MLEVLFMVMETFPYVSLCARYSQSKCARPRPLAWVKIKFRHANQKLIHDFLFDSNSSRCPIYEIFAIKMYTDDAFEMGQDQILKRHSREYIMVSILWQ